MEESNKLSNKLITTPFSVEGIRIEPSQNFIIKNNQEMNIQPKVMDVLTYLASNPNKLILNNSLIDACWPNQYISDSPLHKCIAQIRKALGDDPKQPTFIKTIPKKGYVFIASVELIEATITHENNNVEIAPYPGNMPYSYAQHHIFFGREQIIEQLMTWARKITPKDPMWLSISAPAGLGKSSLVYAGILPKIKTISSINQKHIVLDLMKVEESDKPHTQLLKLLIAEKQLSPEINLTQYITLLETQVTQLSEPDHSQNIQSYLLTDDTDDTRRFILFIDHIEAIFDAHSINQLDDYNKACFFGLIHLLVSSKQCFLITCIREQFFPLFEQFNIDYQQAYHYELPYFSNTELTDIIKKPIAKAGISYEFNDSSREFLDNLIIKKLQSEQIPIKIIQLLLSQLHNERTDQIITFRAYEDIGGIQGCIATAAEMTYQSLSESQKVIFSKILFQLLTLELDGTLSTKASLCPVEKFKNQQSLQVINQFIDTGIFQLSYSKKQLCVSISFHSLLNAWERIKKWKLENITLLYNHLELKISAKKWLNDNKNSDQLLPSKKKVVQAITVINSSNFSITSRETQFIKASTARLSRLRNLKRGLIVTFIAGISSLAILSTSLIQKNEQITQERKNAEGLISFMLYDLKDRLEPLGKIDILNIVANKSLEYYKVAGTENLKGISLYQWAETLHILADVNINKGNYQEAEHYVTQTIKVLEQALKNDDENEKLLELTMLANYWLGYSAYLQSDYKTTHHHWHNYLKYANTISNLFPKLVWKLEQSYALNNLGALAEKQYKFNDAAQLFEHSASIKVNLLKSFPSNKDIRIELADTRSWQSNIHAKAGKLLQAVDYSEDALSQVKKLYTEQKSIKLLKELVTLEHKLALLYYDAGQVENAKLLALETETSLLKLVNNDEQNQLLRKELLWNQVLLAQIAIANNQIDHSLVYLEKANDWLAIIKQFKHTHNIQETKELAKASTYIHRHRARALSAINQTHSAISAITKSLADFHEYTTQKQQPALYVQLHLTQLGISIKNNSLDQLFIQEELQKLASQIEKIIDTQAIDYTLLSTYALISALRKQLNITPQPPENTNLLKLYQQSDYNVPSFLIIDEPIKNQKDNKLPH